MPEKFEANNRHYVSILKGGVISIPGIVVTKAQLRLSHLYDVHLIRSRPFMLLFRENPKGDYKLSAQGKYGAAKFTLRSLYNRHLLGRIGLPVFNLEPLIWDKGDYRFGLILEEDFWTSIPFTPSAAKDLSENEYGVYACVGADGQVLRIGEGLLRQRMQAHLREQWLDIVEFRHFLITDENSRNKKADGLFYEQVFLRGHCEKFGRLPKYNDGHH
jgi:hypothetical protein